LEWAACGAGDSHRLQVGWRGMRRPPLDVGEDRMTESQTSAPFVPAAPRPPQQRLSLLASLRTLFDNSIAAYPEEAYDALVLPGRVLTLRSVTINDPDGVKHVLLDNAANYAKTALTRKLVEPLLGKGILTSEGAVWRRQRRVMSPAFDRRSILSYTPVVTEEAEETARRWEMRGSSDIDIGTEMMWTTFAIICRTMFSADSRNLADTLALALARSRTGGVLRVTDLLGLPDWLPFPWRGRASMTRRAMARFDAAVADLISKRTSVRDGAPKDLLTRLIEARDEETGDGMSAEEVRDQVVTIFFAGHETTAVALTWTWYLLSQHPAAEAKLHGELDSVLAGRTPRHEDLAALPYTRMVIEEAMRLYPPAHTLVREALADDEVAGHPVRKGTMAVIVPWVIHRHRRLWERPQHFEPERFSPERSAGRPRFAYIPFGAGPRVCIGAAFAMTEAMLILATLGQRYRLRLAPGQIVEPRALLTLRPRHGMKMIVDARR
jgi:cytochrome P450